MSTTKLIGIAAILVPVAYISGRFLTSLNTSETSNLLGIGVGVAALGALIGIPIGLFFGSLRNIPSRENDDHRHAVTQQDKILQQVREELIQNKTLFEARKGNSSYLTRIEYLTGFWNATKASGQLFVMQEPRLLNIIATAYYWIQQASHLEQMAYESQYSPASIANERNSTNYLIKEARLLDGPLDTALQTAINAIDAQLATDRTI